MVVNRGQTSEPFEQINVLALMEKGEEIEEE
jgi:hypothetical protein